MADKIPYFPAVSDNSVVIFGSNAVCRFVTKGNQNLFDNTSAAVSNLLDIEEFKLNSIFASLSENKNDHNSGALSWRC